MESETHAGVRSWIWARTSRCSDHSCTSLQYKNEQERKHCFTLNCVKTERVRGFSRRLGRQRQSLIFERRVGHCQSKTNAKWFASVAQMPGVVYSKSAASRIFLFPKHISLQNGFGQFKGLNLPVERPSTVQPDTAAEKIVAASSNKQRTIASPSRRRSCRDMLDRAHEILNCDNDLLPQIDKNDDRDVVRHWTAEL